MTQGHNNPPNPIEEALAPHMDTIAEAENWLDGTQVENEDQMKAVDAITKDMKACLKELKAAEKSEAAPLHDAWKAAKARWKPAIDDIDLQVKGLVSLVGDFKKKLAAEKARKEREAWEAAEVKRKEAERIAAEAAAGDIEAQREAQEAKQAVVEAEKAARAARDDKPKGMRTVHKYKIESVRDALHWIARNDKAAIEAFVAEYVRTNFKAADIDGVKKWTEKEAF